MKVINRLSKLYIVIILLITGFSCQSQVLEMSVLDYGAVNNGETLTTKAIQSAINKVSEKGGGVVKVPKGKYLSGTILLKDDVTLHLEKGAEIIGSHYLKDYYNIDPFTDAVGQKRGNCLVGAKDAKNIAITGEGVINGRGERMVFGKGERSKRPFLIRIVGCTNVEIRDVVVRNSAAWTIHLFQSKKVNIDGIRLLSQSEQNGDGIDIDSSQDIVITNCDINAHDDAICFKSTSPVPTKNCKVSNCLLSSSWGAIKFGTESMGDFENIEVSDCYIYDTKGGGVKILSADGANIKNLNIHDLEMNDVEMPIFIRLGSRLRTYRDAEKQAVGSMNGIKISNIKIHGKRYKEWRMAPASTVFITGIPEAKIKNVRIENIDAKMYFAGAADLVNKVVPENERTYPEYLKFGVLPAYGAYVRHAENIQIKNFKIHTVEQEQRHLIKIDNVKGFKLDGLYTEKDEGAVMPIAVVNSSDTVIKNVNISGSTSDNHIQYDK